MRAVGVDLGERRIGVAVSDSGGVLASPYTVVQRSGDVVRDRQALADIVADVGADVVVVGLPLSLSGAAGKAAQAASEEAIALAAVVGVPVATFDERLTTVEAARRRRERAGGAAGGGRAVGGRAAGGRAAGGRAAGGRAVSGRAGGSGGRSRGAGGSGGSGGKETSRGAAGREGIDAEAAAVMLGAWLEAQPR
jgi:putative Holliday junction resolvase